MASHPPGVSVIFNLVLSPNTTEASPKDSRQKDAGTRCPEYSTLERHKNDTSATHLPEVRAWLVLQEKLNHSLSGS